MSYAAGTILTRKEPFIAPEEVTPETPDLTPYNEIEVIGPSPIQDQLPAQEWVGQLGSSLSVKPTTFGTVIDRPQGELQRDYDVTFTPPPARIERGVVEVIQPGPSPEEVFAAQSADSPQRPPQPAPDPDAPSPEDVFAAAAAPARETHAAPPVAPRPVTDDPQA